MRQMELTVQHPMGLHARAAARLVTVTSRFRSRILFCRVGHSEGVDGKSILGVLMMAAARDTRLWASVEGSDENEAMEAVASFFERDTSESAGVQP